MSPKLVYLFRHGETDWNLAERFQGHTDVPLNEQGRETAHALVPKLASERLEAILSSDLSRAFETGKVVADAFGIPITQDVRLREAHLGGAQGLTRHEIEAKFGIDVAAGWRSWKATDADVAYPGGETGREVTARVFAGMDDYLLASPHERIGVASHGGVIRRVMARVLPENSEPVAIPNGVVYVLRFHPAELRWEFVRRFA